MTVQKHIAGSPLSVYIPSLNGNVIPNACAINPPVGYMVSNSNFTSASIATPVILNPIKPTYVAPYYCLPTWNSQTPPLLPSRNPYSPNLHYQTLPSPVANYGVFDSGFVVPLYHPPVPPTATVSTKTLPQKKSHRLLSSAPTNQSPPLPLPGWKPFPYGLERYWIQGFIWLFMEFYNDIGDVWTLEPTEHAPLDEPNSSSGNQWTSVVHTAKVRFNCQKAGHGWTSMQGRVVFWFRMRFDGTPGSSGQVLFKLYGQKCDKCNKGIYETPLWYPEEVFNALWHLHLKVGECYYGRPPTAGPRGVRSGKPLRPHRPELCQACNDGICKIMNKEQSAQN